MDRLGADGLAAGGMVRNSFVTSNVEWCYVRGELTPDATYSISIPANRWIWNAIRERRTNNATWQ